MRVPTLLIPPLLAAALLVPSAGGVRAAAPASASTAASAPSVPASAASGAASAASAASAAAADFEGDLVEPPPPPSPAGQRVYEAARAKLVQVRTLLKGQDSQSTVGSGFLVSDLGHLITNYHVISTYALQPTRYRLVYSTADGHQGALELLDVDVVHDLALLRPLQADAFNGRGLLAFRPRERALSRAERIYSLGNPLDVGFAVAEGAYNGLVERSFVPTIFFGGSLSAGMSGGPALDSHGRVIGVNVATRRDGEQISFLVPGGFAKALLERSRDAKAMALPAWPQITRQLLDYQEQLSRSFLALPWRNAGHPRYAIPLPRQDFVRCWGRSTPPESRGLEFERSDCNMDHRIYVNAGLYTGWFGSRYEAYDGHKLGALRFSQRYSASFRNEFFGIDNAYITAPRCHERFVDRAGLPLRAVVCVRAHKKLRGLYELSVLVATVDQSTAGVQGRFDAHGVSFANAQRLAAHYLDGFAWNDRRNGSR